MTRIKPNWSWQRAATTMKQQPVSFPDWKDAIAREPLSPALRAAYIREIISFLKHCKACHAPATVELVKQYLPVREKATPAPAREALRWFFRTGRKQAGADRPRPMEPETGTGAKHFVSSSVAPSQSVRRSLRLSEPGAAAQDLGGPDWERDLIKASRERNFLWRTEETYRGWAARFVNFLAPKSPYAAGGEEVAAFLSALAVELRASPSTQKQALNALVFLMQEA